MNYKLFPLDIIQSIQYEASCSHRERDASLIMTMQKEKKIETDEMLRLLRVVKENPQMTQRDLSFSIGVSLGKVNFLMKAMIDKGFIKAQNFRNARNKTAYLYNLTPSGLEAKARITYHFLKRKMAEYEKLEKEIQQLKTEVENFDQAAAQRQ